MYNITTTRSNLFLNIYSPKKVMHHLTCFNNIFSNEFISNRFAVFVTCTHILTYLWNRLLIDFYLCVKCQVYFSTFVFANESWFVCVVLSFIFYWFGMVRRKWLVSIFSAKTNKSLQQHFRTLTTLDNYIQSDKS